MKKTGAITEKLVATSGKIQNNIYLKAITNGFTGILPVLLIGAIFTLIQYLPIGAGWAEFLAKYKLDTVLTAGANATTGMLALYLVVSLGYSLGNALKKNAFVTAMLCLFSFMMVTPFSSTVIDSAEQTIPVEGVIPANWLGPQGVFTALIVGFIASLLYNFLIERNVKIKMPSSVPPMVIQSFEAFIPATIILIFFLVVRGIFAATSFGCLSQCIYTLISKPLVGIGSSFPAFLVCVLVVHILWIFGLHGTAIVESVMVPIWMVACLANQQAYNDGKALPYLLTYTFVLCVMQWIGGPGLLSGLILNMILFAKSERYKALGRLSAAPGLFNIIEPVVFGFPIVLNPLMAIPFILIPIISLSVGYFLMVTHIIGIPAIFLPWSAWSLPGFIGGWLVGAGVKFAIFLIILYVFSFIAYYPFFKAADAIAVKEEKEIEARQLAEASEGAAALQ